MLSGARKAWIGSATALTGYLIGVLDPSAVGLEAFAQVTTVQWLGAVGTTLASFGLVYAIPNVPPDLGPGSHEA